MISISYSCSKATIQTSLAFSTCLSATIFLHYLNYSRFVVFFYQLLIAIQCLLFSPLLYHLFRLKEVPYSVTFLLFSGYPLFFYPIIQSIADPLVLWNSPTISFLLEKICCCKSHTNAFCLESVIVWKCQAEMVGNEFEEFQHAAEVWNVAAALAFASSFEPVF